MSDAVPCRSSFLLAALWPLTGLKTGHYIYRQQRIAGCACSPVWSRRYV